MRFLYLLLIFYFFPFPSKYPISHKQNCDINSAKGLQTSLSVQQLLLLPSTRGCTGKTSQDSSGSLGSGFAFFLRGISPLRKLIALGNKTKLCLPELYSLQVPVSSIEADWC